MLLKIIGHEFNMQWGDMVSLKKRGISWKLWKCSNLVWNSKISIKPIFYNDSEIIESCAFNHKEWLGHFKNAFNLFFYKK